MFTLLFLQSLEIILYVSVEILLSKVEILVKKSKTEAERTENHFMAQVT